VALLSRLQHAEPGLRQLGLAGLPHLGVCHQLVVVRAQPLELARGLPPGVFSLAVSCCYPVLQPRCLTLLYIRRLLLKVRDVFECIVIVLQAKVIPGAQHLAGCGRLLAGQHFHTLRLYHAGFSSQMLQEGVRRGVQCLQVQCAALRHIPRGSELSRACSSISLHAAIAQGITSGGTALLPLAHAFLHLTTALRRSDIPPEEGHHKCLLVASFPLGLQLGWLHLRPLLLASKGEAGIHTQGCAELAAQERLGRADLQLLAGVIFQPVLVTGDVAVNLALVEEEAGVAEGAVGAEGAAKLLLLGVLAVLVVQQRLLVLRLVGAVLALEDRHLVVLRVFHLHVLLQLVLALASKATHLTDQTFSLVPQLVAAQLVGTVAPVRALVALVPVGKVELVRKHEDLGQAEPCQSRRAPLPRPAHMGTGCCLVCRIRPLLCRQLFVQAAPLCCSPWHRWCLTAPAWGRGAASLGTPHSDRVTPQHTHHTSSTSSIAGGRLDPKEVIIQR